MDARAKNRYHNNIQILHLDVTRLCSTTRCSVTMGPNNNIVFSIGYPSYFLMIISFSFLKLFNSFLDLLRVTTPVRELSSILFSQLCLLLAHDGFGLYYVAPYCYPFLYFWSIYILLCFFTHTQLLFQSSINILIHHFFMPKLIMLIWICSQKTMLVTYSKTHNDISTC